MTRKIKKMPIIPPKENEIERHNAYNRINPMGQTEFVISRNGKEEETLNELSKDIDSLLENIEFTQMPALSPEQAPYQRSVNQPEPPQIVASRGESARIANDTLTNMTASTPLAADGPELSRTKSNLRSNALDNDIQDKYSTESDIIQNESFTSTAGLAIIPNMLGFSRKKRRKHKNTAAEAEYDKSADEWVGIEPKQTDTNGIEENFMSRSVMNEWEPPFKGEGYDSGDYQMQSPTGDGVAARKPKQDNVGKYDTDTKKVGKEWPGSYNDTAAMCDVDEDGVENEPQGSHESSVGEPNDGHQTKLGHNWPDEANNSGGGVAEPFKGNRWKDGGTLKGSGQDEESNDSKSPGLPKEGPITGTKGAQMGEPMEWSPELIGDLLGEDVNLQDLFNNYAKSTNSVSVHGFQNLCDAHGLGVMFDDVSLLSLMSANNEFMFYEYRDSNGSYWITESIIKKKNTASLNEDILPEFQVSRGAEGMRIPSRSMGMSSRMGMPSQDNEMGMSSQNNDEMSNIANMDQEGNESGKCPGCGYIGIDSECPDCGELMIHDTIPQDDTIPQEEVPYVNPHEIVTGPRMMESLEQFMISARSMVEHSKNANRKEVAEALNHSWGFYASNIDPRTVPTKVNGTLKHLMTSFPGFNPLLKEDGSDTMESSPGKAISSSSVKQSPHLNKQPCPDDMEQHGSKDNPLHRDQKNTYTITPIMKGTEKGLTGTGKIKEESKLTGTNAKIMRENANRLAKHIQRLVQESAKGLRGKYSIDFSVVVVENSMKNRTPIRGQLSEAIADSEEILQFHSEDDVTLETRFKDSKGMVIMKSDIPLVTITPRGPIVSEGRSLFRFKKNAELFAEELVENGIICRIQPHNWGSAVSAKVTMEGANDAFRILTEKKKWMQNVKHTGECTPMTKSTCTGRKKAFAKRVQKSGDLYSGK